MIGLELITILICMFGGAFFSGIETGVISIDQVRLKHFVKQGSRNAKILEGFMDDSDRLLGTTLVGTNICTVVISVVAASMAVRLMGALGHAVSTAVVSVTVLLLCEFLPKAWFHSKPYERSARFAGVLRTAEVVLLPVSRFVVRLSQWLVKGPVETLSSPEPFVTKEDLKQLARDGEKNGALSPKERVMIHRVFELSGKRARDIMVPREEMICVDADASIPNFYKKARETNLTRMPVYDRGGDLFMGVVNVFSTLAARPGDMNKSVSSFARTPLFIPDDMPVDDIFPMLRHFRQPMSLVRDSNENVIGLITTEDILEEIVGKL